jgi:hypothetical protein
MRVSANCFCRRATDSPQSNEAGKGLPGSILVQTLRISFVRDFSFIGLLYPDWPPLAFENDNPRVITSQSFQVHSCHVSVRLFHTP